jgi:predicted Zn-dependent protease
MRVEIAIFRGDVGTASELARAGPADHARLNIMRGKLAMIGRDPKRAATYYRAALRQDPDDRDAIHGLGTMLKLIGDPEAGKFLEVSSLQDQLRRTIVDSVVTIRTDPQLFDKLGTLCDALGRRREARAWYQLAIARDPLDQQAQAALARLDRAPSAADAGSIPREGVEN